MSSRSDDSDDDGSRAYFGENVMWMLLWICTMLLFICLPFYSSRRRKLCMRGIRERRWISDDDLFDDNSGEPDQQVRRQQIQENHRHFRTNRTQEDEIRQQYLLHLMENYTMSLTKSDIICEAEGSVASEKSKTIEGKEKAQDDDENDDDDDAETQCEATIVSTVIDSRDTIDNDDNSINDIEAQTITKEKRSDSDDFEELLGFEFVDDQKVSIPLSGTSVGNKDTESKEESFSSCRRLVSNGCAICLCLFEQNDKITWSSNSKCSHVFHSDCILNWYLAVGRKAQKRRKRENRSMSDEHALSHICKFPILCPCCRQEFCIETSVSEKDGESGSE